MCRLAERLEIKLMRTARVRSYQQYVSTSCRGPFAAGRDLFDLSQNYCEHVLGILLVPVDFRKKTKVTRDFLGMENAFTSLDKAYLARSKGQGGSI